MKIKRVFSGLFVVAMLGGCASGFDATYDYDHSVDFASYKNFAWISENPMHVGDTVNPVNPLLEQRIMAAVEAQLGAKGYTLVNAPDKADFVMSFTIGSRNNIKVDQYPSMAGGYYGAAYPRHWGWGGAYYCCATDTQVRQYTNGMLALDVFDEKEKRPVWHGVATKNITDSDRKDMDKTVSAAVSSILQGFPPPPADAGKK